MESEMPFNCFGDARQVAVERALNEFRAARPVAIRSGDMLVLAFSAEGLTARQIAFLQGAGRKPSSVRMRLYSRHRVSAIGQAGKEFALFGPLEALCC